MEFKHIRGATAYPGAPANWDADRDGPCGALPIREIGDARAGRGFVESAWRPTLEEMTLLNAGRPVVLRVYGWQPPVAVYVSDEDLDADA